MKLSRPAASHRQPTLHSCHRVAELVETIDNLRDEGRMFVHDDQTDDSSLPTDTRKGTISDAGRRLKVGRKKQRMGWDGT